MDRVINYPELLCSQENCSQLEIPLVYWDLERKNRSLLLPIPGADFNHSKNSGIFYGEKLQIQEERTQTQVRLY